MWAKAPESGIPFNTGNIMTRTSTRSGAAVGTRIGTTTYDLQTNSAEPNRIHVDAAGNVSATWTGSVELASGWADRGAFYNYYDGSAWGAEPTSRIETVRTGWPELVRNGTNDVVFSHDPGGFGYTLVNTSVAGSGAWQEIQPSGNLEGIWPRAAANGSYIYMINANYQSAAGNNYVQYYRSADGGNSFDIMQEGLPGIDTASGYSVMGGDSYQIIARDSIVAIVAANSVNDLAVWISHSNGDLGTFNRTRILDFPIDNFDGNVISDVNGDNVPDTLDTNDGSHTVLVDNSGKVHIWSGATRVLDDTPGDDGWSFFPCLLYTSDAADED